MNPPKLENIKIRMYRGILGDCFLLRTSTVGNDSKRQIKSILIDCGVLQHVIAGSEVLKNLDPDIVDSIGRNRIKAIPDGSTRIRQVVNDILSTVSKHIDILVVTHEHYDHLSGFAIEHAKFEDSTVVIDQLWMAWTENYADQQANSLRARISKGKQALVAVANLAGTLGIDAPEVLLRAAALASFVGPAAHEPAMAAKGKLATAQVMEMLKDKVGPAATHYFEPGQVIELNDFGLRAYILGPPRDERLLRKDLPARGASKEVYLTRLDEAVAAQSAVNARIALHKSGPESDAKFIEHSPFAAVHSRPFPSRRKSSIQSESLKIMQSRYNSDEAHWRRIDDDWIGAVDSLALKMDSDTNNTSLVIAFELPDGQVLLFPGDAQIGNWLSWHEQTYPKHQPATSVAKPITANELLRRTTFYKGAHHLSHNATAKQLGLEQMTDQRLVVAAPLVEAVAALQGKGRKAPGTGWKMPYPDLYTALKQKTKGRIVRGDGEPQKEKKAFADTNDSVVKIEHSSDGLWVELTIEPS